MKITISCRYNILCHDHRSRFNGGMELGSSTLCYFISLKRPPASVNQPQEHTASEVHHADWNNELASRYEVNNTTIV